jgi:hypothetical protein
MLEMEVVGITAGIIGGIGIEGIGRNVEHKAKGMKVSVDKGR